MRLVTYDRGGTPRAGLAAEGWIADLEKAARSAGGTRLPASSKALLEAGDDASDAARKLSTQLDQLIKTVLAGRERRPAWAWPEEDVHLGPPVPDPQKVICVGLNYADHCREQEGKFGRSVEIPADPVIFAKFPTALTGPYDPILLPTALTQQVDYEAELAIVIGREITRPGMKAAGAAIAGYMVLNDVSARDCQFADKQWVRAKSMDTFAPCGPWLVSTDEIENPHKLKIWTAVNGVKLQDSSTREMIFKLPRIVHHIARGITLKPGDIITTGTPAGVGIFRDPPVLLKDGDTVEVGIERIGTLCNTCAKI